MNKLVAIWNSKSEGAKSAVVFTIAILMSRAIAFITTPIFTRIMPTDQIGIVGLYTSSFAILSSITSLGLNSGGFMVGLKDYEGKRDQYISSILTLTTLSCILVLAIFLFAPSFFVNLLGLPKGLIALMIVGCVVTPAYEFWLMRQRYEYAYKKAAIITVLTSVVSTLLAVIAVLLTQDFPSHLGETRIYVSIGSTLLVYFVFWIAQFKRGCVFYNKVYWTSSLAIGLPLLGHSFASQILNVSDRILISKYVDNSAVGIYTTLYTVGSLALMFWGAINSSFVPYLFQSVEKQGDRKGVAKISLLLLMLFSAVTVCVSIMAPEVVKLLAPSEYLEYIRIIPPIVAGVYFIAFSNFYTNILVYCKKTLAIMFSTIVACVVSIVLNIMMIPKLGFEVAAYNTLFSYIIFALLQAICGYKEFRKRYEGVFVYNNYLMVLVTIITVALSLICIPLYEFHIIRYLYAAFMIFVAIFIYYRKNAQKNIQSSF